MLKETEPQWVIWGRRLAAVAQNGLTYAENHYDLERYMQVREVATEMMAAGFQAPAARIQALLAGENGYATPKVDTRGVVFREGKLLLVRELADGGRWTLPGGWADVNDTPSAAVEREIFEEAGFITRAEKLLAVYDRSKHGHEPPYPFHISKLFFRCIILGGEATTSVETGEVAFFGPDEIPELSSSRVTAGQIARCFAHLHQPDWPTDFD